MKPLSGLRRDSPEVVVGRSDMRALFGVWPVARMTKSYFEGSAVPSVRWTGNGVVDGNPASGTLIREPVMNLDDSVSVGSDYERAAEMNETK